MRLSARRFVAWASLCAQLAAAAPGYAQDDSDLERAKASFKAGANAYAVGDYLAAIQALEAAYALTPLPAITFSLAQAERKQYGVKREREHLERALALYRRYLEQDPGGARRSDALAAIVELEPQLRGGSPVEAAPKAQARPTRVMIVSDTPGARIALDGSALSGSPLIREVTPGKHHAHVEAAGYYDIERDVTALAGELILSEVRLSERLTSLYVWAPAGASIYVDGVYVAEGGELATVPLQTGAHQLMVAQKGRRLVRRDVRLTRGQTHTEYVALEPTTQRVVSNYLFMGSGLALGVGVVLSAFAVRSENSAENFLALQNQHHAVGPSQLVAYNASLVERTRFRTAAALGVAGSLGMFITGLFLHELDQPSLAGSGRRRRSEAGSAKLEPRFDFSPVTATGHLGASLQLNF
ncbi:MAG TPA: PEGA domain-containing protein [Polyangiaceae bacterium]|nr:PEGA domain-containing protein [Polyangiaceae bacterium]